MSSYTSKVIAVFGRTVRAGRWKVADDSLVIAVFGRCVLDLTRAYVDEDADDELGVSVFSLFGSVSILLPQGCDVEPSGVAIAASSEVKIPSDKQSDVTADVLAPFDISFVALFAKVRIVEVVPELSEPVLGASPALPSAALPSAARSALDPPAIEVFDPASEAPSVTADKPEADAAPAASSDDTDDTDDAATAETDDDEAGTAESEAAALRDEIAQWRAESGREPSTDDDAVPEIVG